jgi:hypothetical protein
MAKERKSKSELEAIVFAEARRERECEDLTDVSVVGVADERVDFNWEVSSTGNSTRRCEETIARIVARLQKRYDLVQD